MSDRYRFRARSRLTLGLAACCLVALGGCNRDREAAENALRDFLRAARFSDREAAFALIVPEQQDKLRKLAQQATAHTGAARRFSGADLIASTHYQPQHRIGRVEMVERKGDVATIKVISVDGSQSESWQLRRIDGRWRVELPDAAFEPPRRDPPASAPTSAPATSQPATSSQPTAK